MKNKKLITLLLAVVTTFAMLIAVACGPIGEDPDFTDWYSSSTVEDSSESSSSGGGSEDLIAELLTAVPDSSLKLSVTTPENHTAESSWFITYGESGLEILAYVVDSTIYKEGGIYANDAIEVGIAKVQDLKGYSAGAISVSVDATGAVKARNLANNEELTEAGIVAEVTEFTFANETIDGYYVELFVPYAATEVSKDAKDAAVIVGLTNATDFIDIAGEYESTYGSVIEKVNTWMAVTDSNVYAENEYLHINIDVLFMGDSYVSKDFWNAEGYYDALMTKYGINAVNLGKSGSQINEWAEESKVAELGMTYAPTSVVLHIGVNDVDDAHQDAQTTYEELVALYELYHATFKNADLYWVSLIPNCVFTTQIPVYAEINEKMEAWAADKDWMTYINVWDAFCSVEVLDGEIAARPSMFGKATGNVLEGMHLNVEYGYPVWSGIILESLGYTVDHGTVLGDNVEANAYASMGWTFSEGEAVNNGLYEKAAFYPDAYGADILFEAEINSSANTGTDDYPKAGLTLRSDKAQVFAYFDIPWGLAGGATNMVYRPTTSVGANADWLWNAQAGEYNCGKNVITDYIKVGIAKKGDTVYMLIDGKVVNQMKVPGMGADVKVVAGVMGFNRIINVKNVSGTDDANAVAYAILTERHITAESYEGTTVNFNKTVAKLGDTITFTIASNDPISEVKVNGETVVASEGVYSFVMTDADAHVTISFLGKLSVDLSAVDGKITASTMAPYEGDVVTFTAGANVHIAKLYANEVEIVPENGVYSFVASENLVVTGELYSQYDGVILDGVVDADYGSISTLAEYDDNRTITLRGVKTDSGVIVHVVAVMNTTKTDSGEWHLNTNFEFQLNGDGQRHVNIVNHVSGVNDHVWYTTTNDAGKYVYTVELFVEGSTINGWNDKDSVQINYAWKTAGETSRLTGNITHPWALGWKFDDWWSVHSGGLNIGSYDFNEGGLDDVLQITDAGLMVGVEATQATIDGNLEEYAGLASETFGDPARAQVTLTGKAASDGLYLGLTIVHGNWSVANNSINCWHLNDNVEIKINNEHAAIAFFGGKLLAASYWDRSAAVTTTNSEGKQVTTVELFKNGNLSEYRFQTGMAGEGFGGWQALVWDNNQKYITADGLTSTSSLASEVALDGNLNDAIWTSDVLAKSYNANANGADVTMVGVSGNHGVYLAFTVKHSRPLMEACQGAGDAWWNFMGPEIRIGNYRHNLNQIAVTAWNNSCLGGSVMGYSSVDNGDGTYTTVYEIFISYGFAHSDNTEYIELSVGGVFETGFTALWGGVWGTTHYITSNGIVTA